MEIKMKPTNKLLLKIIGVAYVAFIVVLFIQFFAGRNLYPLPRIEVEVVDLKSADVDELVRRRVLPAAVLEPRDLLWHRFKQPLKAREDVEELFRLGVRRLLVFPRSAQKAADSIANTNLRLAQPLSVRHNDREITLLPAGIMLKRRELALLELGGYGGKKIVVTGKGEPIGINATAAFVVLNFLILVVVLHGLLWDPLMKVLDERARRVQEDLNSARLERQRAEELRQRYENALAQAHTEAEDIKFRKLKEAAAEGEKIIAKAREDARRLLDDTKKQVEAEFVEARRRLQREAAQLAVSIARKILEREVDEKKHHDLVARFIKETGGDTQ